MKSFPLAHQACLILGLLATPFAHADPGIEVEFDSASQTVAVTVTNTGGVATELEVYPEKRVCTAIVTNAMGEILYEGEANGPIERAILMAEIEALAGNEVVEILRITVAHAVHTALQSTAFNFNASQRQPTGTGLTAEDRLTLDPERFENKAPLAGGSDKVQADPNPLSAKDDATGLGWSGDEKFIPGNNGPSLEQRPSITK